MNVKRILLGLPLACFLMLGMSSCRIGGASIQSKIVRMVLVKKAMTPKTYALSMSNKEDKGTIELPKNIKFPREVREYRFEGMQVFEMSASEETKPIIFYLHGGAYINNFSKQHFAYLADFAKQTGCGFVAPNYPLLPLHTAEEAHRLVLALYLDIVKEYPNRPILLMGDSAGGGFSLALAQQLRDKQLRLPNRLVLLSPWVDVDGADDSLDKLDNWLDCNVLRNYGKHWAGALDTKNPIVSPLYGDMRGLPPTDIFVGTWEVFYTDNVAVHKRLEEAGVQTTLHVAPMMGHVYVFYPIPEGKQARKQITETIKAL